MESVTIPAHIEGGSVRLDAPLPSNAISVEVRVKVDATKPRRSVAAYLRSLPPGTRSGEDIDRDLREERDSWPD
jgi:hypothetical protein